jgi:transcriptional regulator with XRE-family HTH domain
LRREEVAMLAGVSVGWYPWIEQGRAVNASNDVLDALARALRLDPVERDHLFALAGVVSHRAASMPRAGVLDSLRHLLAVLEPAPAYVLGPRWDFLAWNRPFLHLYPTVATIAPPERNLVWVMFGEPSARELIGDWENEARRVLSQFRAEIVPFADDPELTALVARLEAASPEFSTWWPRHDVAGFETHRRTFEHPTAGRLVFDQQQLVPAGDPDLRVMVHLPIDGDDSAQRLASIR